MGNSFAISNSLELDDSPYSLEDSYHFRFDEFLQMNGLQDLKALFIKYNMVTPASLSPTSDPFRNLIHDRVFLNNPQYIAQIVDALHAFGVQHKATKKKSIIIDEDDEIFEEIQQNIELLHSAKVNINEMNLKHPNNEWYVQSARNDQIEETKKKINASFDNIAGILKAKQNGIINQLDSLKRNTISAIQQSSDKKATALFDKSVQENVTELNMNRNELLVFGYIRQNSLVLLPLDIMQLCAMWYQCWTVYNMHEDIVVYSDMIRRKYPCSRGWITAFAADVIGKGSKVVKKLRLVQNMESNIIRSEKRARCWIIVGILETAKITQYGHGKITDFTDREYGGVGFCLFDCLIYSGGASGNDYCGKSRNMVIGYGDVISVEIDHHKTVSKSVFLRYAVNNREYGNAISVELKGDLSLAVAINAGETDYIQLVM